MWYGMHRVMVQGEVQVGAQRRLETSTRSEPKLQLGCQLEGFGVRVWMICKLRLILERDFYDIRM